MQRLIIPDLWIPLSGLLWSWYRIHCRRSLYFCAWMIRWYLNLAQNLKMFQNCLTMLHTTVPTIWMDTALWVSCSAYLSGIGIKYLIFPFLLAIICGRKNKLVFHYTMQNKRDSTLHEWSLLIYVYILQQRSKSLLLSLIPYSFNQRFLFQITAQANGRSILL